MSLTQHIKPRLILLHIGLILVGTLGGLAAQAMGLPLPFVLGSLILVAIVAQLDELAGIRGESSLLGDFKFDDQFRALFIALIGVAIGAQITWAVIAAIPRAALSFLALTLFVPIAFWVNYQIFRRVGKYDHATAFFSASPGGLYEAIMLGEKSGADIRLLTLAQFLRIIFVVTLLPIGLSLYIGHPVGSSGGMSLSPADAGYEHVPLVIVTGLVGLFLGYKLNVPAPQLIGPLLAAAVVSVSGLAVLDMPPWMLSAAQIVIGTTLGTRFTGIRPAMLMRGAWLGFLTVGSMLVIGGIMAIAVMPVTGESFDVLLISFSPGGVTEMALIALSLNANPAFVTMHHLYRIVLTVFVIVRAAKRFIPDL